jgi:hypothetical protein
MGLQGRQCRQLTQRAGGDVVCFTRALSLQRRLPPGRTRAAESGWLSARSELPGPGQ